MKKFVLTMLLMGFLIPFLPRMGWVGEMGEDEVKEVIGEQMTFGQAEVKECPECPLPEEEAIKLPELVVTAFYGGAVTITPTKTIIDVEKFEKSGLIERVEDILTHLTGIDVMRTSTVPDPQQMIMMRGFDDSRFTIAIDGRPITSPTAGADTFVDWSSLTTADIEKIEVTRGGASALYENSQGGIINIITKKGKKGVPLFPKITLQSDCSSFDTYGGRVAVEGGVGNLGYFFNYGYRESDGYLRNNYSRGNDYSARLNYLFPFKGNLTLSYKGSVLDMGYPVVNDPSRLDFDPGYPIVREDADTMRKFRTISYPGGDSYKERETTHLDLIFEQSIKSTTLKVHLFQTTSDEDSYWYALSGKKLVQMYSGGAVREEKHYGGIFQYRLTLWENNSLTVGYDQRRMETEFREDIYRIQAGYFEDIWTIAQKLTLNLGLRYAHVRELTSPYADPGTKTQYKHKIKTDLWLPKCTVSYKFSPKTEAYVSVNRDYHLLGC